MRLSIPIARKIIIMRPEDKRKLLTFIGENQELWHNLSIDDQFKWIDNITKSGQEKEIFRQICYDMPIILDEIKKRQKLIKVIENKKTESIIEEIMLVILSKLKLKMEIQKQISKYRVDFLVEPNIIIECDGYEYHRANLRQILNDSIRDKYLVSRGYVILRYSGYSIFNQVERIKQEIQLLVGGSQNGNNR